MIPENAVPNGSAREFDPPQAATTVLDGRGVIIGWSRAAERLLGYPAAEVLNRPAAALLAVPGDAVKAPAIAELCRSEEAGWDGSVLVRHRGGRHLQLMLHASPMLLGDGGAMWSVSAVKERPSPSIDMSRLMFEPFLAHSRVGMAVLDTDLRYVWVNEALERSGAMPAGQRIGRRATEVLPGLEAEAAEAAMRQVLETGIPVTDFEFRARMRAAPTRERTYRLSFFRLEDGADRVLGVWYMVTDVNDSWRVRQRLTLLTEAARSGHTLNVEQGAQELAGVVVPRFADFVTVDLLDSVLSSGEAALDGVGTGPLLRCAAQRAHDGSFASGVAVGAVVHPAFSSLQARSLLEGRTLVESALDISAGRWAAGDPDRVAKFGELGIHSVLATPVRARGITLGVTTFARSSHADAFDDEDVLLAEELVGQAAICLDNARRFTRERSTALALQRSLLPRALPMSGAVDAASRYFPADTSSGVGGDWFDLIPLSGARVALVVGDVVGHGINAAATMGRIRTAVRTLADLDVPPDELLAHLDDLALNLVEREGGDGAATAEDQTLAVTTAVTVTGATCLYAVYDPVTRRCTLARAGHLPPAIVAPEGTVTFPELPPGPPLGLGGLPFEPAEFELPEGSLLALYTDGLIASRDRDVDVGLSRLAGALAQPGAALEEICEKVVGTLPAGPPHDDVALLLARTHVLREDQVASWDLSSDTAVVARAREDVGRRLEEWGLEELLFTTELIVSELVTNAIRYGEAPICLRLIRQDVLICEVSDASSTSPRLRHARTTDEGGRGLFIVAQLTPRWGTRYTGTGKTIWTEQNMPSTVRPSDRPSSAA